jgi:LuxR family maltose regulon positive regulatory protein
VSLDNDDKDLRQFLNYLLAAIQRHFPKNELRSETLLKGERLRATGELARYLLNDLNQVPESFILVLDDYQRIKESSVHDLVAALLEHPAQTMHLVLLTRKDPSLPIATMRGRGPETEIRASDLRFTSDEGAAFLSHMLNVAVDDDKAALLAVKFEGWGVGLRLAGLYLQGQKDLKLRVQEPGGSSGHIAEYLTAEVLSRQHPEMVSYLLEASILDRFCAPLCGQMHLVGTQGRSGKAEVSAEQFLQWLLDANLFVIALDDEGYWFRYHYLFRSFLTFIPGHLPITFWEPGTICVTNLKRLSLLS